MPSPVPANTFLGPLPIYIINVISVYYGYMIMALKCFKNLTNCTVSVRVFEC